MTTLNLERAARREHRKLSVLFGGGESPYLYGASHKTEAARKGWTQIVSHLLPASDSLRFGRQLGVDVSDWDNLCKGSTKGCRALCLTDSGRLSMSVSKRAAFVRSYIWQTDRDMFATLANREIRLALARINNGDRLVVRTMGTHDGQIEKDLPTVVDQWPDVMFNDYTKLNIPTGLVASNVYRCKSATERTTGDEIRAMAAQGLNVAVPFDVTDAEDLPTEYHGVPVVNGDYDDLRFLDPEGVVVGLSYKRSMTGKTVADGNGFIHEVPVTIG